MEPLQPGTEGAFFLMSDAEIEVSDYRPWFRE
jgi:hypothetical protein